MQKLANYIKESSINETSIYRLNNSKHFLKGYIIISACRYDRPRRVNAELTAKLKTEVVNCGFSWIQVKGGYIENQGTENEHEVMEPSFIVSAYLKDGSVGDVKKLKSLAIKWCGKYDQESVLVCEPDQKPTYYKANGEVDSYLSREYTVNRMAEKYFTKLGNSRFTFKPDSVVTEKLAPTLNGLRCRTERGEITHLAGYYERNNIKD